VLDPASVATGAMPLVMWYWSSATTQRTPHVRVVNCLNFSKTLECYTTAVAGVTGVFPAFDPRDVHFDVVPNRSFITEDMNTWGTVISAGAATWLRSSLTMNGTPIPVWNLHSTAAGTSHGFGVSIDAALYPNLWNKYVCFGMWTKVDATDKGAHVYVGIDYDNTNNAASTAWTWVSAIFKWPTSGTLLFAAAKLGTATGDVYFAAPLLFEVGTDYYTIFGRIVGPRVEFTGGGTPSTGTWVAGDRVWFSPPPGAGASPGTLCVTSGTPGTWKAFPNVAA